MKFLMINKSNRKISNEIENGNSNMSDFDSVIGSAQSIGTDINMTAQSSVVDEMERERKDLNHASVSTETTDENRVLRHLQKYYYTEEEPRMSNILDEQSEEINLPSVQLKPRKMHEEPTLSCGICKIKKQGKNENFIVLSCNHIFHVCCLTESHFEDIMNFGVIDQEYFRSRKCATCYKQLETEELMFLHSKFLSGTKDKMASHDISIETLENRLKVLKEELKTCYDYKHKLEREREKSKQIVASLMTMI